MTELAAADVQRGGRVPSPAEPAGPDPSWSGLPVATFAFPGPLRDRLVAAILSGAKTGTSSLRAEYAAADVALPRVGDRFVVVDSAGRPVCVIETTAVDVRRLADVDLDLAVAEGEGFESVAAWRAAHEGFWRSPPLRRALGAAWAEPDDDLEVVVERFAVVARPEAPPAGQPPR